MSPISGAIQQELTGVKVVPRNYRFKSAFTVLMSLPEHWVLTSTPPPIYRTGSLNVLYVHIDALYVYRPSLYTGSKTMQCRLTIFIFRHKVVPVRRAVLCVCPFDTECPKNQADFRVYRVGTSLEGNFPSNSRKLCLNSSDYSEIFSPEELSPEL
jgi:hypothetical protein